MNKVYPNVSQFLKVSGEIVTLNGFRTDPIQIATGSPCNHNLSVPFVDVGMTVTAGGEVKTTYSII
jgi:hypothetical protein